MITEQQFLSSVSQRKGGQALVDAIVSGDVQKLGDQTAIFEATILSLVFRAGRMEGQSGNAMSNKDFDRLKEMLNVKGGIVAFENVLRTFMADKIRGYDLLAKDQLEGPVGAFIANYNYSPVKEPLTFQQAIKNSDDSVLQNAYKNTVEYTPQAVTVSTETTNNQLETFINSGSVNIAAIDGNAAQTFNKEDVDKFLLSQAETYKNKPDLLLSAKTEFLKKLASSLGTTYENLVKLGGYE